MAAHIKPEDIRQGQTLYLISDHSLVVCRPSAEVRPIRVLSDRAEFEPEPGCELSEAPRRLLQKAGVKFYKSRRVAETECEKLLQRYRVRFHRVEQQRGQNRHG